MLSKEQFKYMVLWFLIPSIVINFLINGGLGYLTFDADSLVPLWGMVSLGGDTLATTFFLTFFTFHIVSRVVAGHIKAGAVAPWPAARQRIGLVVNWPNGIMRGAILLSAAFLAVFGPVAIGALQFFGPAAYSVDDAVLVKAAYSALLTLPVIPVVVALALREQRHVPAPSGKAEKV